MGSGVFQERETQRSAKNGREIRKDNESAGAGRRYETPSSRCLRICVTLGLLLASLLATVPQVTAKIMTQETVELVVQPGDTWQALAWRYKVEEETLRAAYPHPNPLRQPVIGDAIQIPAAGEERNGQLFRSGAGGLLQLAVRTDQNPWALALANEIEHPHRPLFWRPIFVDRGDTPPRDLPAGFTSLELSQVPAQPGRALAFRGMARGVSSLTARLGSLPFNGIVNGRRVVGIGGTGAFFRPGAPELSIAPEGAPAWTQPWRFVDDVWDYDQVTLTGEAAEIDQEAIAAERARLFQVWSQVTPEPQWTGPFELPIFNYLRVSSNYGARRSYNGGPYASYHEGVDFSAYEGTPVYASAAGTVVVAERLYVRGGAVIVDHGLGVYSGYYHMSAVHAEVGQQIEPGDLVGEVGTTGLSSGNHLHWDLLTAATWVDAAAWREDRMGCWILEGWGRPCP